MNKPSPGYFQDQRVVYQNNGGVVGDVDYFKRMLGNISNHINALAEGHVEIRVVDFGAGADLFLAMETDTELAQKYDALRALGVRFLVCANTLKSRQLDWRLFRGVTEEDIVPSGVAELARLQHMGFACIRL